MKRVESGPVQFEDDWPGVFIRGDNALGYAIEITCGDHKAPEELVELLQSCDARTACKPVHITRGNEMLLRLSEEFQKCVETCNDVYAWYVRREGKYQTDDTAQSWLRIINENFNRAKALHYIQHGFHLEDGSVPGIQYVPGPARFTGKTS